MNRRFVTILYIAGAGGNFVSRCLNLLSGFHVWEPVGSVMPSTTSEKLDLLAYNTVLDWSVNHTDTKINWNDWEHRFKPYADVNGHCNFPPGEVGVRATHPWQPKKEVVNDFIGQDDTKFVFYIDPAGMWDWMLVHAEIKDSHQFISWFKNAEKLLKMPDVYKINLKNIVTSQESFIEEFDKICKTINHKISQEELDAVLFLYKQWKTTTVDEETIKSKKTEMIDQVNRWYNELIMDLNGPR